MRHPFIKKAKKNNHLMDLIDRYRKWKLTRGDESDTDSGGESGGEAGGDRDVDGGQDHHAGDVDGVDHVVLVPGDVVRSLVDQVHQDRR